jgi:hypothetical protein
MLISDIIQWSERLLTLSIGVMQVRRLQMHLLAFKRFSTRDWLVDD